jgi:short-subunit dehydrogenase
VSGFAARYGPWAVVAGGSEGLGAAFARALADRGLSVVLVARRPAPLEAFAATLPTPTRTVAADLATPAGLAAVTDATADLEVGFVVANAAYSAVGPFLAADPDDLDRVLDLNCRAPLRLARAYLPAMVGRGRGGLVVMTSIAGNQGLPRLSTYAASKAFGAVLAEGLWAETRPTGVHVLACAAGAVSTPALAREKAGRTPGELPPDAVARAALRALGRGPRVVPGAVTRLSAGFLARVLPRGAAIRLMDRASRDVRSPG